MSMHMIRGVQVHGSKRRKSKNKSKSLLKAEADMEKFYAKMGIDKDKKSDYRYKLPDYDTGPRMTSDKICGHGPAIDRKEYNGERQLIGIATMHKSNMVPIFADRKEDAKDIASMRR